MSKEYLQKAVDIVDGQVALARAIKAIVPDSKISQGHIWKWLNLSKEEVPPAEYVIPIAKSTDWQVTPHELRSDIYPHPSDGLTKEIEEVA